MDLRMYHFHDVSKKQIEHIQDCDDDSKKALCGYNHHNLISNGDTITLEWANQNIPSATALGMVCKMCSKLAMKKLESNI